jgi:hypothetical protein
MTTPLFASKLKQDILDDLAQAAEDAAETASAAAANSATLAAADRILAQQAASVSESARDVAIAAGVQYPTEAAAVAALADGAFGSYLDGDGLPVYGQRDGSEMVPIPGGWLGDERISETYSAVANLIASTAPARGVGRLWVAQGFRYSEAASDATDQHLTTAGGVTLYALPNADGLVTDEAVGVAGNETTDDRSKLAAVLASGLSLRITKKCGLSGPLTLNDGQKIIGTSPEVSGFKATTVNAQYGLQEGLITVVGAFCVVENLSLDGHLTSTGNDPVAFPTRSSGIYLRATSSFCTLRNVTAHNMTRHGICFMGFGHTGEQITAGNTVADNIGFGSGEEAAASCTNMRLYGVVCEGSQGRGAIEVDDGSKDILVEGIRVTGQYAAGGNVFTVADHNRPDEDARRITFRDAVVLRTTNLADQNSKLIEVYAGTDRNHQDILFENIRCESGCAIAFSCGRDVRNIKLKNVVARGLRAAVLRTTSVPWENLSIEDCQFYIDHAAWIGVGATSSFGMTITNLNGLRIINSKIHDALNHGISVGENCADVLIDGVDVINPNRASVTGDRNAIRIASAPASGARGIAKVTNCTVQAPDSVMTNAVAIARSWTNAIVQGNVLLDYRQGGVLRVGTAANNQIIGPNIGVYSAFTEGAVEAVTIEELDAGVGASLGDNVFTAESDGSSSLLRPRFRINGADEGKNYRVQISVNSVSGVPSASLYDGSTYNFENTVISTSTVIDVILTAGSGVFFFAFDGRNTFSAEFVMTVREVTFS